MHGELVFLTQPSGATAIDDGRDLGPLLDMATVKSGGHWKGPRVQNVWPRTA